MIMNFEIEVYLKVGGFVLMLRFLKNKNSLNIVLLFKKIFFILIYFEVIFIFIVLYLGIYNCFMYFKFGMRLLVIVFN